MSFDGLPKDWHDATLKDVVVDGGLVGGPFGSSLGRKDYVDHGVPVIRGANIAGQGRFDAAGLVYVTAEKVEQDLRRNTAAPGDIVLTQRGTLGQVGVVPQGEDPLWVISQSQERLRVEPTKADRDFVYFVLQNPKMKDEILRRAITTGVPHINLRITAELPLPLPPLDEQQRIARTLNALDDKIESNRRIAATLEETAATLFKARFVDFVDHDDLVESEIGPIPRGWEVAGLSEVVDVLSGRTPKTSVPEYWGGSIPWISVKDTLPGPYVINVERTITDKGMEESRAVRYPAETVVITARGTVGNVALMSEPMTMNQSCYALQGRGHIGQLFVFHLVRHVVYRLQAQAHGSVFATITRNTFDSVDVVRPPENDVRGFEELARPLFDRIQAAMHECLRLGALRDALLPKLISGQIRVPADGFEDFQAT